MAICSNSWVMTSRVERNREDAGYLIHGTPWRESSMIVEVFTEQHGRLSLLAKGVRRPRAALRGVLQPFQRLQLSWFGQEHQLRTLKQAEWLETLPLLHGRALFCGFYLNELLYRLMPPDEGQTVLFPVYDHAMRQLLLGQPAEPLLRSFEYHLLRAMGLAPAPILASLVALHWEPERLYQLDGDGAVIPCDGLHPDTVQFHGKTLQDMAEDCYEDPRSLQESKRLMRWLLSLHLGGREIHTRRILQEIPAL